MHPSRSAAAVGLAALLSLTACSEGDDTGSTTASPSPTGDAAVLLSEEELEARLLTLDDLPSGFVESAEEADAEAEADVPFESDDPQCQAFLDATEDSSAPSTASVAFESEESGTLVQEDLESFEDDGAEVSFEEAREGLGACDEVTVEGQTLTLQEQSFEDLGDDTVAAQLSGQIDAGGGESVDFTADVVSVRIANNVVNVTVFTFAGGVDTEEIVRTAVEKFQEDGVEGGTTTSPTATTTSDDEPDSDTDTDSDSDSTSTPTPTATTTVSPTS